MSGLRQLGHMASMMALLPAGVVAAERHAVSEHVVLVAMPERYLEPTAPVLARKADSALLRVKQWALVHAAFLRRVAAGRADWVVFGVLDPVSCLPLRLARAAGFRCAGVAYASEIRRQTAGHQTRLRRRLSKLDIVVAVSRYSAGEVTRLGYPPERTAVVHPAVTLDLVQTAHRIPRSRSDGPTIVTVARLVKRKAIDHVLMAMAGVRSAFPRVQYDIIGDGPERANLEAMALALGLGGAVRFHGTVPDEERNRLVASADLFVLTPRPLPDGDTEGFGIVYLEAGALGRPVVASRCGGVPEAVRDGENGVLVEPADVRSLTEVIRRLLDDPRERERLGEGGRRAASDHLPERCALQLITALGGSG